MQGRNVAEVEVMLNYLAKCKVESVTISVELEKPRAELNSLLPLVDVVFLGRDYAQFRGWNNAQDAVVAAVQEAKPG